MGEEGDGRSGRVGQDQGGQQGPAGRLGGTVVKRGLWECWWGLGGFDGFGGGN